jgi:DNA-directed RNA polymerase subunit omega
MMIEPRIERLLEVADSKFTLVTVAAKRSRQINAYFSQLGEGISEHTPPQVPLNPERAPKTLSIALKEISEGMVEYERNSEATN